MNIPESVMEPYLTQAIFVKPDIVLDRYSLRWDKSSYGIPQREVSELKSFLRDILPYVSGALFKAAQGLSNTIETEVDDIKIARKIEDSFSPRLLISRNRGDHLHVLEMRRDGTAIIKRKEQVRAMENVDKNQDSNKIFHLEFVLGELVFAR